MPGTERTEVTSDPEVSRRLSAKVAEELRAISDPDLSPEAIDVPSPSPKVHGLDSHDLSAREQIMRQWPTWNWEKR